MSTPTTQALKENLVKAAGAVIALHVVGTIGFFVIGNRGRPCARSTVSCTPLSAKAWAARRSWCWVDVVQAAPTVAHTPMPAVRAV